MEGWFGAVQSKSRARLLKRVFEIDMEHCPNCGGELKIIAAWRGQWSQAERCCASTQNAPCKTHQGSRGGHDRPPTTVRRRGRADCRSALARQYLERYTAHSTVTPASPPLTVGRRRILPAMGGFATSRYAPSGRGHKKPAEAGFPLEPDTNDWLRRREAARPARARLTNASEAGSETACCARVTLSMPGIEPPIAGD